jgi:hypothetical protein
MRKFTRKLMFLILLVAVISGCYPGGPEYIADLDLITTNYSPEYWENDSALTYYMPDSLGWIIDRDDPENNEELERDYDQFILDEVAANMLALGYTRLDTIDDQNQPDLIVFTQALAVRNTTITYVPGYPWWNCYYPYWCGYWYYYPWGYRPLTYSYETGTIIIEIADLNNIDSENQLIEVVWNAGINGLLRSSESGNQQFVSSSIEKAFNQSSYLNTDNNE